MDILFPVLILIIAGVIVAVVVRSISNPHKRRKPRTDGGAALGSAAFISTADEYSHLGSFDTDTPSRDNFGGAGDFSGGGSGGHAEEVGGGNFDSGDSGGGDSGADGGGSDGGSGNGGGGDGGDGGGGGGGE